MVYSSEQLIFKITNVVETFDTTNAIDVIKTLYNIRCDVDKIQYINDMYTIAHINDDEAFVLDLQNPLLFHVFTFKHDFRYTEHFIPRYDKNDIKLLETRFRLRRCRNELTQQEIHDIIKECDFVIQKGSCNPIRMYLKFYNLQSHKLRGTCYICNVVIGSCNCL